MTVTIRSTPLTLWPTLWLIPSNVHCDWYNVVYTVAVTLIYTIMHSHLHCDCFAVVYTVTVFLWSTLWLLCGGLHCDCYAVVYTVTVMRWSTLWLLCGGLHCDCYTVVYTVTVIRWSTLWLLYGGILLLRSHLYLWGSPFLARFLCMWPFLNPTIKVVPFHLCGWCMLGAFFFPAFTRLGYECQNLWSLCNVMHVCRD